MRDAPTSVPTGMDRMPSQPKVPLPKSGEASPGAPIPDDYSNAFAAAPYIDLGDDESKLPSKRRKTAAPRAHDPDQFEYECIQQSTSFAKFCKVYWPCIFSP